MDGVHCAAPRTGRSPSSHHPFFLGAFAQLPPSPSLLDSVAARLAVSRLDAAASIQN